MYEENRSQVFLSQKVTKNRAVGNFGGRGYVYGIDCGVGFMVAYLHANSKLDTLNLYSLCMSIIHQ